MHGGLRKDIEGLRAIAVLGVVGFHVGIPGFAGGFLGVDIFYVISGFLITFLMLRDLRADPSPTLARFLADFYARRVRRILPAATIVIIATLAVALVVQTPIENATLAAEARSAALFFSNMHFARAATDYFAESAPPSPFSQFWSLSLEEQFYFVWPILLFTLTRTTSRLSRRHQLVFVVVGTALSFALCVRWSETRQIWAFYALPARAWELGVGAVVALLAERLSLIGAPARSAGAIVGAMLIVASLAVVTRATPFPGWAALPTVLGTALLLVAGTEARTPPSVLRPLVASRSVQRIGRYSFALYLWHWPVLTLQVEHAKWAYATWQSRALLMLAVAYPLSIVTYHLVENPVRLARGLRAFPQRTWTLASVLVVVSVVASGVFHQFGTMGKLSTARSVTPTGGVLTSGVYPTDFVPQNIVPTLGSTRAALRALECESPCRLGPERPRQRVVVAGNSHALHWSAAFTRIADSLQIGVTIETRGACSSYPVFADRTPTDARRTCTQHREAVFRRIRANPPDLLIFSNLTGTVFAEHPDEWTSAVRTALRMIPRTTRTLVFSETPRAPLPVPFCLTRHLTGTQQCDVDWPVAINAKLRTIAEEEGATFVDLRDLFCTPTRCPAITEDHLIYADANHITSEFARSRAPWFARLLANSLQLDLPRRSRS